MPFSTMRSGNTGLAYLNSVGFVNTANVDSNRGTLASLVTFPEGTKRILIQNIDSATDIRIGNSTVLTTTGIILEPKKFIEFDLEGNAASDIYLIAASTAAIACMFGH